MSTYRPFATGSEANERQCRTPITRGGIIACKLSTPTDISTIMHAATKSPRTCRRAIRWRSPFPEFDHLHFRYLKQNRRATGNPSPEDWNQFLDKTEISWTVLYPTAGLAVGRIMAPEWAVIACKAYNNWLYEKFFSKNSRLKGVALIPFQDVDAAVIELRRAVKELGMLGGMLPSNGEAIQGHLGK